MGADGREGFWLELLGSLLTSGVFLPYRWNVILLLVQGHGYLTVIPNKQGKLCTGTERCHPNVHLKQVWNFTLENNLGQKGLSYLVAYSKQGYFRNESRSEWSVSGRKGCYMPVCNPWGTRASRGRLLNDRNRMFGFTLGKYLLILILQRLEEEFAVVFPALTLSWSSLPG